MRAKTVYHVNMLRDYVISRLLKREMRDPNRVRSILYPYGYSPSPEELRLIVNAIEAQADIIRPATTDVDDAVDYLRENIKEKG